MLDNNENVLINVHGNKGRKLSEETKKKISEKRKGIKLSQETRNKMSMSRLGRVFSEETRKKISLANTGKKHTEETKRKIGISNKKSLGMLGKTHSKETRERLSRVHKANPNRSMLGKKHTEEAKMKISKAHKGKIISDHHKAIVSKANTGRKAKKETVDLRKNSLFDGGYTVPIIINNVYYKSIKEAARTHNVAPSTVKTRCRSDNFYGWSFAKEDGTLASKKKQNDNKSV